MAKKAKQQHPTSHPVKKKTSLKAYSHGKTILATLILGILAVFAPQLTHSVALWGFSYPAYAPGIEIYVFLGLALAALSWAFRPSAALDTSVKSQPALYWLLAGAVTGGGAWLVTSYPVAFAFLGDGAIYIGEVFRIASVEGHESNLMKATTWLGGWAVTWFAGAIDLEIAAEAFQATGLASFLLLFTGMFILLRKEQFPIVLLWILVFLGSGGMLVFFGYMELYALGYALVGLYFLASWASFRKKSSAAIPGILLAVAIAATASNAIFIPSYLLLLHWKMKGTGGKPSLRQSAVLLVVLPIVAVVLLYVIFGLGEGNPYLIPIGSFDKIENGVNYGTQAYSLFSGMHLLDAINVIFLTSGIGVFLLLAVVLAGQSVEWKSPTALFGIVAVTGALLLILTGNTTFGMARDWDIMISAGPAIGFLAIAGLHQLSEKKQLPVMRFVPLIGILAIAPTYSWVKVNHEEQPSALRFKHLVEYYKPVVTPAYTYNALENLRKFYFSENMTEYYLRTIMDMGSTGYDMLANYRELIGALKKPAAKEFAESGFTELLQGTLENAVSDYPQSDYRHIPESDLKQFTVHALLSANEAQVPQVTREFIPEFRAVFHDWPEFTIYEAYQEPREEPLLRFQKIQDIDVNNLTDIALIIRAANLSKNALQLQKAAELYERALEIDPHQYQNVYLTLAEIYYRGFRDKSKTINTLERCMTNCIGSQAAEKARTILSQIQAEG